jgi:parallel beta-helix repeat protein
MNAKLMTKYFAFLLLVIAAVSAQTIVISPDGPVKTLVEARDAARALRRSGMMGPITIRVHAGTYDLSETLILGPEDSDTIWEAPHGEHPVVSGGRRITGWSRDRGNVWKANAPDSSFHQLFINGRRATRARTPNYGFFRLAGKISRDAAYHLSYRGSDIKKEWAERGDVELVGFLAWIDFRMPIAAVDEASHAVTLGSNSNAAAGYLPQEEDARYFIENTPDALDAPGEWYLDKGTQTLSYIAAQGEDMEQDEVIAPRLSRLVSLEGKPEAGQFVRNVVFRGLTFAYADWAMDAKGYFDTQAAESVPAAIEAVGTVNFRFEKCTVAHSGGYGLSLGQGAKSNQVLQSEFYDLGGGGIKVGERQMRASDAEQSYENVISDNQIHDLGLVYAPAVGILVLQSARNQILHNHVHDLYYTAISVGWTWGYDANRSDGNLIAFNHLHSIGRDVLSDLGGIYTLGVQPGTVIRNNLIHDVSSFTYGGWGIYMDEGSSGILIENNVVYGCKSAGFHQHYGRDNVLRNNVFAFNREYELMRTRTESHSSFTAERNIVYFDQGDLLGGDLLNGRFTLANNIYFDRRGADIRFWGRSFSQWQAAGQDHGSIIADPLFRNADNFDFTLRAESPALRMGFQQIDVSTVGPRVPAGADTW